MRFLFRPPAAEASGLLGLPWDQPLEEWDPELLLEVPQRGISRHVVRFVASAGHVFALKEIHERLARHEYGCSGEFEEEGLPTVSVLGICVDRPDGQEAILVTRYLEYSMSYRWLFSSARGDALGRAAPGHDGRAARPAAPGRCVLGRLLAVQHAVPAGRRRLGGLPGRRGDRGAACHAVTGAARLRRRPRPGARGRRAAGPAVRRAAARRHRPDRGRREAAAAVRGAVGRGDPRGGLRPRRAAVPGRRAAAAAQRPGVRRRRGRADHLAGRRREAAGARPASPSRASTAASCSG